MPADKASEFQELFAQNRKGRGTMDVMSEDLPLMESPPIGQRPGAEQVRRHRRRARQASYMALDEVLQIEQWMGSAPRSALIAQGHRRQPTAAMARVLAMNNLGMTRAAIGRRLGIHRGSVTHLLQQGQRRRLGADVPRERDDNRGELLPVNPQIIDKTALPIASFDDPE